MITIANHLETSGGGFTQHFAKCTKGISTRTQNDVLFKPRDDELRGQCASSTAAAAGNTRARQKHPRRDSYHHEKLDRDSPQGMEETRSPRYPDIAPRMTHQSREKLEHVRTVQGTIDDRVGYENGVGKWTRCEVLGRGAHGVVYRGITEDTLESIAIKQIQTSAMGRSQLQAAENEIRMLPRLQHPNVVRFLGVEEVEDHLNIFLEYLDMGSVRDCLKRDGRMSEDETALITSKILAGLAYLHSRGITHRDIKGANVLLSGDGAVKLTDFGTSKLVGQESVTSGLKGTPHWMAPEVIRNQQQGHEGWTRADIWSLGCTVIEMLTGKMPWPDIPEAVAAMFRIAKGSTPPIDRDLSSDAVSFIRSCCCPEPSQRHTVEQLMNHPFLWRPRHSGAEALHLTHGQQPNTAGFSSGSSPGELARGPGHFFDAAWPSDGPREQQWLGGPSVTSSRPRVCQSLSGDGVVDESEFQLLLRGVSSGEDERQRPPCRSHETAPKLRGKPRKNARVSLIPQRSPRTVVTTPVGAPPGDGIDRSEASRTVLGPNPKPLPLPSPLPNQLGRMRQMLEKIALSQGTGRTRHSSTRPTRSLQHGWLSEQKDSNIEASLFAVSAAQGGEQRAPSPSSSLSGASGGSEISSLGFRMTAHQQRQVGSKIRDEEKEGERASAVCRLEASFRREATAGLAMKSSRVCRESSGSDERWFADKQKQHKLHQKISSALCTSLPEVPSASAVDRSRRAERGGSCGRSLGGVGSSSSTMTSPVLRRRTSMVTGTWSPGFCDEDSRESADAPITRRGMTDVTIPHTVIAAAREDLEGLEIARAGRARPEGSVAGECINTERHHRGVSRLAPGGYPGGNAINAGRNIPPACNKPPRCGRSSSASLQQQHDVMRTRSAGAIATAVKLPPLGKEARRKGEDRFGGGSSGEGEGVLVGVRLITSAPTMVGSSSSLSSKARADAAARVAGGVAGSTPGRHDPVDFLSGERFVPAAAMNALEPLVERRSLAALNSSRDRAGDDKDGCQRGRPASFARVRANAISPLRTPVAGRPSTESAKGGGLHRPKAEGVSRSGGGGGSAEGGDFASILSRHSPHFLDAGDSDRAPFATSREVRNPRLRRETLGAEVNGCTANAAVGKEASSSICSGMSTQAARKAGGAATGAVLTLLHFLPSPAVRQGF